MKRLLLAVVVLTIAYVSSGIIPVASTTYERLLVTAVSAAEPINTSPALNIQQSPMASCSNPVVRVTKKFTQVEQDAFVKSVTDNAKALKKLVLDKSVKDGSLSQNQADQEMKDFTAQTLPSIEKQAHVSAPAEEVHETVFDNNPLVSGGPPAAAQDPNGSAFEAWAAQVKAKGCSSTLNPAAVSSTAVTAAYYTPGQKSCTDYDYTTNSFGGVLAKVTQTDNWLSNSNGWPSSPWKTFSTPTGYGWSTTGKVQGGGPSVTVSYGIPLQYHSWTGQNFHFQYFKIELYSWYGEVDHWYGFSNQYGPICWTTPWWP